jgi:hypothetical protein
MISRIFGYSPGCAKFDDVLSGDPNLLENNCNGKAPKGSESTGTSFTF